MSVTAFLAPTFFFLPLGLPLLLPALVLPLPITITIPNSNHLCLLSFAAHVRIRAVVASLDCDNGATQRIPAALRLHGHRLQLLRVPTSAHRLRGSKCCGRSTPFRGAQQQQLLVEGLGDIY